MLHLHDDHPDPSRWYLPPGLRQQLPKWSLASTLPSPNAACTNIGSKLISTLLYCLQTSNSFPALLGTAKFFPGVSKAHISWPPAVPASRPPVTAPICSTLTPPPGWMPCTCLLFLCLETPAPSGHTSIILALRQPLKKCPRLRRPLLTSPSRTAGVVLLSSHFHFLPLFINDL